ncbi:hypothetical protein BDW42DRAFT_176163 [Aspergillus taichungensis]|uniref:RRM domain-containing protein n=1 Tax=Aspergillus taichungensis TaxID=482145 RepID=A0A2J5HKX0_9EURO|nr:hypothetical protein BDW42DRAFT_176163 [Aspergillus taichungensis]
MAAGQQAVSFNEIIQAGRQKKRNEELASRLLGKNRRASAPGSGAGNKAQNATPGSLASRIGVAKRPASAVSKPKKHTPTAPAPVPSASSSRKPNKKRRPDENRLFSALNSANGQASVRGQSTGLSIKGAGSGPFVVVGSNFAPGTTAADIQAAIEPISGHILNCWVTSQHPTVTAEIAFEEKSAAENAIANFHNKKADGMVISLRFRSAAAGGGHSQPQEYRSTAQNSFNDLREQADRDRRLHRAAGPAVQDGSYGFNDQNGLVGANRGGRNSRGNRNAGRGGRNADQNNNDHGLYSDEMMVDTPSYPSRGRGKWQR